jgi:O-antigen/teichoic acid export membrane protein
MLLRVVLLAVKFLFMLVLARETNSSTVGIYALLTAVTTMTLYFVGAELHTYAIRETVVAQNAPGRSEHFQNHLKFVAILLLAGLPISWSAIRWLKFDDQISFALYALVLFGEVFCQELGRYLIARSQPVASNLIQLLRGGAWMPVAVLCFTAGRMLPLQAILLCWAGGCASAMIFGMWKLRDMFRPGTAISWEWLVRGSRSASFYFVVAVLAQVQNYADRLIVQVNLGPQYVGQLSFFQSFANTMQGFAITGVLSIALPDLLLQVRNDDLPGATQTTNRMLKGCLALGLAISTGVMLFIRPILAIVGKREYEQALDLLPWMLLGNFLIILGQVQHYRLYALRKDGTLMTVALVSTPLSLVVNVFVTRAYGLKGTIGAFVFASLAQTLLKWGLANRAWNVGAERRQFSPEP